MLLGPFRRPSELGYPEIPPGRYILRRGGPTDSVIDVLGTMDGVVLWVLAGSSVVQRHLYTHDEILRVGEEHS